MGTLLQDVRYTLRMLAKNPGFAAVAVITLALGIGANTTVFSIVDALLLRPLPFRGRDRLVMVWEQNFGRGRRARNTVGPANFIRWKEHNSVFEDMAAFIAWPANLTGSGAPERVGLGICSPNLFSLLGVQAAVGRNFLPEEERPGKDDVVMLSWELWQRRFGGDPKIIGQKIELSGTISKPCVFPCCAEGFSLPKIAPTTR